MNSMITNRIKFNIETVLYFLIFCFPLFAISVRHWSSVTFSLLLLSGFFYLFSKNKNHRIDIANLSHYMKYGG